jgi:hypothetical protein
MTERTLASSSDSNQRPRSSTNNETSPPSTRVNLSFR